MIPALKTFSILTPVALAGLALAACGEQATPTPSTETPAATDTALTPATTPATTATVLGKVDLNQPIRVLGTEPSWSIDVTPATVTYSAGMDGAKQTAENKGATVQGETATWTTQTQAGVPVQLTTTLKDCSDGMSDRIYPLTATAKIGNESVSGCAASLRALEAAGESGRVE